MRPLHLSICLIAGLLLLACKPKEYAENHLAELIILPDSGTVVSAHYPNDIIGTDWMPGWRLDVVDGAFSALLNIQCRDGTDFEGKTLTLHRQSGTGRCRVVYTNELQIYPTGSAETSVNYNAYRKRQDALTQDTFLLFLEQQRYPYFHVLDPTADSLVIPLSRLDTAYAIYPDSCIVATEKQLKK